MRLALLFATSALLTVSSVPAVAAQEAGSSASERTQISMMHASDSALTARVTPRFAFTPTWVRALVQVLRHPDNRLLRIAIDSGGYYRSSDIQLDGADAPRSHFFVWKSLPPGNYCLEAIVYGPSAPRARVQQGFRILGQESQESIDETDLTGAGQCAAASPFAGTAGLFDRAISERLPGRP